MSEFEWKGDEVSKMLDKVCAKALFECAQDLKSKSMKEAPIKDGFLRGSCDIDAEQTANKSETVVFYAEEYALRQHEELNYRHPQGGKAKYLEDPFKANVNRYENDIKEAVSNALK
jgi:hypothetical protein